MQQQAVQWANAMGRKVVNAAKERIPVDEGRARASLTHTVDVSATSVTLRVGSPLPYVRYLSEGTGIYGPKKRLIRPTTKQALKFPTPKTIGPLRVGQRRPAATNRGFVFAKSVRGIPPNSFFRDALAEVFGAGNVRSGR